jgi:hypothetical protein
MMFSGEEGIKIRRQSVWADRLKVCNFILGAL